MLLLCELLLQQKELVVKNHFRVDVLNEDPEPFRVSVNLLFPLEIWRDGQLDAQSRPCNWLDVTHQVQLRKLMNVPFGNNGECVSTNLMEVTKTNIEKR